jgi:hypothetical protein
MDPKLNYFLTIFGAILGPILGPELAPKLIQNWSHFWARFWNDFCEFLEPTCSPGPGTLSGEVPRASLACAVLFNYLTNFKHARTDLTRPGPRAGELSLIILNVFLEGLEDLGPDWP